MENKVVFGRWEAIFLLLNTICAQVFLNFPRIMAQEGLTAGWILVIYNSILVLLAFALIVKLFAKFEGKDILDISEGLGGNSARIAVGMLIVLYFIFAVSSVLREFGANMKKIAFPAQNIDFIFLFVLAVLVGGAYYGLEAIARFHMFMVPIIIAGFIIIAIAVTPYYDLGNLFPIGGKGAYSIYINGFNRISTFSALIILFFMTPFIKTHSNLKAVGFITIGMSAVFLSAATIIYLMVIPFPVAAENFIPIYQLAKLFEVARILERIESVFIIIWSVSVLLYLSTTFYFLVYIFKKTFKLDYYRPLIIPFAIIIISLSSLPKDLLGFIHASSKYFSDFSWVITFGMTIVVLVAANMLKRKGRKGA